jgi:ACT domain-containing protein
MKAIITVVGKDKTGIIAKVSNLLYEDNVNIVDISQTIMGDLFVMTAMVDTVKCSVSFEALRDALEEVGKNIGVQVSIQHEDLFNSMHRI